MEACPEPDEMLTFLIVAIHFPQVKTDPKILQGFSELPLTSDDPDLLSGIHHGGITLIDMVDHNATIKCKKMRGFPGIDTTKNIEIIRVFDIVV